MVGALPDELRDRDAHHSATPQRMKHTAVFGAIRPGGPTSVIQSATSSWSNPSSTDKPSSISVRKPASRLQDAPTRAALRRPPAIAISARPSTTKPTAVLAAMGLKTGPKRVNAGIWNTQPL